jgi:hypothetical protein
MQKLLELRDKGEDEVTTAHLAQATGIGANEVDYYLKHHADMSRIGYRREKGHRRNAPVNWWRMLRAGEAYLAKKLEEQGASDR